MTTSNYMIAKIISINVNQLISLNLIITILFFNFLLGIFLIYISNAIPKVPHTLMMVCIYKWKGQACCKPAHGLQGPGTPGRQAGAERDLDCERLMEPRHDSAQGSPFTKRVCL